MLTVLTANGPSGFAVKNSLRFRSSASAYLSRTPASAGNQRTWTWSGWVKRGTLGSAQVLFSSDVGTSNSTWLEFGFDAGDTFTVTSYTTDVSTTSAVFRDPSSWYHIVVAFDSTQSTTSNRCRIYFNGVQQSLTNVGFTLNAVYGINAAQAHAIGQRNWSSGVGRYFDGYMAEINFIDGQALTPSSFGAFDATSGVWQATKYSGTYGTNGFYLKFSDTTSTTTLCYDYSGNSNNWTPNNISLTAGSTYDSMLDSPTNYANGGNGVGNYAVLNPLVKPYGTVTYANANLQGTADNNWDAMLSTISITSGKFYWECSASSVDAHLGIQSVPQNYANINPQAFVGTIVYYGSAGTKEIDGTYSAYGSSYGNGDIIGVALDYDGGTVTFYKNNVSQGAINLSSSTALVGKTISPIFVGINNTITTNFGQRPFAYTPPTGYKALNTQNLPAPSIQNGSNFMAATLYTGNGATQSIVNAVNGVSFQPDFVWIKNRANSGADHALVDSVRGPAYWLASNLTQAESNNTAMVTSINSNGFTVGASNMTNQSGVGLVGWQWKAGGTAVTNTAGSITSSVSANTTAGFSVVTYVGNGVNGATVGHGLGKTPDFVIMKGRNTSAYNWNVYHSAVPNGYLQLNTTDGLTTTAGRYITPGSSVLTLTSYVQFNENGTNQLAYCFAAIPGYSAFGSYTGNGSADGPFVYCGFRPRYVLIKSSSGAYSWYVFDTSRDGYNYNNDSLSPDLSDAEYDGQTYHFIDILSNGFKLRDTYAGRNGSGGTYIYACFAESPLQYSLAR